jgi:hypothetical protein
LVLVFAVVATDLHQLNGACRFLATRDLDLPLVHFELVGDGKAIVAVHGLLGEFLSGPDLDAAIDAVGDAAETLGPQVRSRFGGGAVTDLAPRVDPTGPDWLPQSVRPVASMRGPTRARPSRRLAVTLSALVAALIVAASVSWGAGAALAVALVLGPLLWALVIGPALREPGSIRRTS